MYAPIEGKRESTLCVYLILFHWLGLEGRFVRQRFEDTRSSKGTYKEERVDAIGSAGHADCENAKVHPCSCMVHVNMLLGGQSHGEVDAYLGRALLVVTACKWASGTTEEMEMRVSDGWFQSNILRRHTWNVFCCSSTVLGPTFFQREM